jgi:hypothetical protein
MFHDICPAHRGQITGRICTSGFTTVGSGGLTALAGEGAPACMTRKPLGCLEARFSSSHQFGKAGATYFMKNWSNLASGTSPVVSIRISLSLAAIEIPSLEICIDAGNVIPFDWPVANGFRLSDSMAHILT